MFIYKKTSRIIAVIGLLLSNVCIAKAQNPSSYYVEEPRTFYGGFILGANFCQVDGDSYKGYHKVGVNAGVVVYARLAPKVAGSLEILYSQKGAKSNYSQYAPDHSFIINKQNINLNYVEIPVQINYFIKRKSNFGGGFSYSQLISSKEDIQTNPSISYNQDEYPFKKIDINFILNGQLHLTKGLYASLRFQYSVISIRNSINPEFGRAEQYNNMWVLRLMYLFD
jgi:hypothetical protein